MKTEKVLLDAPEKQAAVRRRKPLNTGRLIVYLVLILQAVLILIPFWIMFVTSIKHGTEITSVPFTWWPKGELDFSGYKQAFDFSLTEQTGNVLLGLWNTLWMTIPTLLIGVLSSGMGAYAYSKINFKLKNAMFAGTLFMMLIPGTVIIIPTYFMYQTIGWVNTPLPLTVPGLFGSAGMVFFLTQYMRGVPNEMFEAAEMDGIGKFGAFWKIMLPVSVPAFIAQFILGFINAYNNYLGPSLYLGSNRRLYTLQVVLRKVSGGIGIGGAIQTQMAYCMLAIVPLVIIYLIFQDKIINGISVSGLAK